MVGPLPEIRDLFCEALDRKTPREQAEYLDQACQGRPELRARVEALLQAHDEASGFLQEPSASPIATVDDPISERPGTVIGPYKLLEQIGEGGFGIVFMAEQMQPIRRKVALKVLKPGMDTRQVVARFEAERQALALMDHPNIAKVFDGGTTSEVRDQKSEARTDEAKRGPLTSELCPLTSGGGRPYFVMELVKGIPITEYCDQGQLTPRERLDLFMPVCQAVQHAHQKGIIHRDIKPSNVLVTLHDGTPVVKVIDFGIAKATGQQLTDKTLFTNFAQLIGTPLYMSPEQAALSGLDVDTRSDIYSLGVLLYELLTGTTPFDKERFKEVGYDEMRRIIREEEPPKPSTRISTLSQAATTLSTQRKSDPKRLSQLFRGELDWIVMKALEKDRNRRYETASAFGADVQRYLHDEPVQACPPSAWYRLRKFARRNRGSLITGALVAATLVVAVVVLALNNVRIQQEEKRTREEYDRAEKALKAQDAQRQAAEKRLQLAVEVLDEICLKEAEKRMGFHGERGLASSVKDPVRERLERDFLEKGLRLYEKLAQVDSAEPSAQLEVARAFLRVAMLRDSLGRRTESEDAYDKGIRLAEKLVEEHPGDAEFALELACGFEWWADKLFNSGRVAEVDPWCRKALALFEKLAAEFAERPRCREGMASCHRLFGLVLARTGTRRPREAEQEYLQALAMFKKLEADFPNWKEGWNRLEIGWTHQLMAELFFESGRLHEAEKACQASLAVFSKTIIDFPEPGEISVTCRRHLAENRGYLLAEVLQRTGRLRESETARRQAVADFTSLVDEFPTVGAYRGHLAHSYTLLGNSLRDDHQMQQAEGAYRQAVRICQKVAAESPTPGFRLQLGWSYADLGNLCRDTQRLNEAEDAYRSALGVYTSLAAEPSAHPSIGWRLGHSARELGKLLRRAGRTGEAHQVGRQAEESVRAVLARLEKTAEDGHLRDARWELGFALESFGHLLQEFGETQKAEKAYRDALGVWLKLVEDFNLQDDREHLGSVHEGLGHSLKEVGRLEEAAAAYREALVIWERLVAEMNKCHHRWHLSRTQGWLVGALIGRAKQLENDTKLSEAERKTMAQACCEKARELLDDAIKRQRLTPDVLNNMAWMLVADANPLCRDPAFALELAELAVEKAPTNGIYLNTLGAAYYRAGHWQEAIATLKNAEDAHQGQYFSHDAFFIAMASWQLGDKDGARKWYAAAAMWMDRMASNDEELRRFRAEAAALLALSKDSAKTSNELPQDELQLYTLILDAYPDATWAHLARAQVHRTLGESDKAQADYRAVIGLYTRTLVQKPDAWTLLARRGSIYAELEQWDKAAGDLEKAAGLGANPVIWYQLALTRAAASDAAGYRKACAGILERFGKAENVRDADLALWGCVLAPDGVIDYPTLVQWAEKLVAAQPKDFSGQNTLGAVLYRAGRFGEALQRLSDAQAAYTPADKQRAPIAYTCCFLAMAHHRLGHAEEARRWLDKAVGQIEQVQQKQPQGAAAGAIIPSNRRLTLQLLRREAQALLKEPMSVNPN